MNILLTGASGLVGQSILQRLLESSTYKIYALSRTPRESKHKNVIWLQGDLLKISDFLDNFTIDYIIHTAAEIKDPSLMYQTNVLGTESLIQLGIKKRIRCFIFLSSVGYYGEIKQGKITEQNPPGKHFFSNGAYEKSKIEAENLFQKYGLIGNNVVILRPSIVFGPNMSNQSMKNLIKVIKSNHFFYIGKQKTYLHYIYVENLTQAILNILKNNVTHGLFNLSQEIELKTFAKLVASKLNISDHFPTYPQWPIKMLVNTSSLFGIKLPLSTTAVKLLSGTFIYDTSNADKILGDWIKFDMSESLDHCLKEWRVDNNPQSITKIARVSHIAYFQVSQLKDQIQHLLDAKLHVTSICGPGEELKFLPHQHPNFKHITTYIPRKIEPLKDIVALCRLISIFRKEKFDIVHSTTPKAGLLCSLAGIICRVPIRIHTFTGQAWASSLGINRFFGILADKIILRCCTQIYADGKSQIDFLYQNHIIKNKDQVTIIGPGSLAGVNTKRFNRENILKYKLIIRNKLNIPPNHFVFGFLGRITRDKGINELITAFLEFQTIHKETHLLLIGPIENVDQGISSDLIKKAQEHPNIIFLEYTPHPEEVLKTCDCLCLPSYREGFGTVVLEAAAMGIPSIGTSVTGLTDSIVENVTGILCEKKSTDQLKKAMVKIITEPNFYSTLSENCYQRTVNLFASEKINQQVYNEYSKIIGDHYSIHQPNINTNL